MRVAQVIEIIEAFLDPFTSLLEIRFGEEAGQQIEQRQQTTQLDAQMVHGLLGVPFATPAGRPAKISHALAERFEQMLAEQSFIPVQQSSEGISSIHDRSDSQIEANPAELSETPDA